MQGWRRNRRLGIVWCVLLEMRIDKYLAQEHPNFSRRQIQELIRVGEVKVAGQRVDPDFDYVDGMDLKITPHKFSQAKTLAEDLPLKIVFENNDFLVVDKPSGLVVHPGAGHKSGTVVNALLSHL